MSDVIVYTKTLSFCGECEKTKNLLDELGVEYSTVSIEETEGALAQLKAAGFRSAPVVFTPNGAWGGHKEDKLRELVA